MSTKKSTVPNSISALRVRQWLPAWNELQFDSKAHQREPQKYFFLFSMKASHLKALTGVYRRSIKGGKPRAIDPNVQRGHEEDRSATIGKFVQYGYPWCEMGDTKRKTPGASDLQKPGWLPTAIIVNILPPGSERNGVTIPDTDLIHVEETGDKATLSLPETFTGAEWKPKKVYPLEVIDGQHRLWAFEGFNPGEDFELPVVAFYGLDHGWQAYLFWSVNITPKRINRSLAFDLYPLLRQQTWLDKYAGHSIYRETRCQELVEALWAHPDSPWHQRINMLGETKPKREYKGPTVTQAAWVRSLMSSLVKQWEGAATRIGGLFGASPSANDPQLPWNRPMQAAVLIYAGNALKEQVGRCNAKWAKQLREVKQPELIKGDDPAFYGECSLISTDQGIRGFLSAVNDLCFIQAKALRLADWRWEDVDTKLPTGSLAATDEAPVTAAVKSFADTEGAKFIGEIAEGLATYDWRTSSAPGLTKEERTQQDVFRGSSGYSRMRQRILAHLISQKGRVGAAARDVAKILKYTDTL